MGDRRHDPADIKPLLRVCSLARLDVMDCRQRERHASRCGILNRREHLQIGRLARLAFGRLRQADPHPLVQVSTRPGWMQVHDLGAGELLPAHHPSCADVSANEFDLGRWCSITPV
jgi:hypothetical protein